MKWLYYIQCLGNIIEIVHCQAFFPAHAYTNLFVFCECLGVVKLNAISIKYLSTMEWEFENGLVTSAIHPYIKWVLNDFRLAHAYFSSAYNCTV